MDNFTLFTNQERVNDTIMKNLVDIGGEVKDYDEIADTLENLVVVLCALSGCTI